MGSLFHGFSGLPTGFSGSTAVYLPEKPVKKFVIGKTVPVYDLHNRIFSGHQFMMDMRYPYLIYMPGKVNSHLLFEKAAEVLPIQTEFSCDIFQKNGMLIVFFYI